LISQCKIRLYVILIRDLYECVVFQRLKAKTSTPEADDGVERRKVNLQGIIGRDKRKEKRGSWGGDFMMLKPTHGLNKGQI